MTTPSGVKRFEPDLYQYSNPDTGKGLCWTAEMVEKANGRYVLASDYDSAVAVLREIASVDYCLTPRAMARDWLREHGEDV